MSEEIQTAASKSSPEIQPTAVDRLVAAHLARVEKWLERWFDRNLTVQNLEGRTDDELAALLIHDLYAAGFRVTNG